MKTILITGATGGIGQATALYLDANGYKTFLLGRNEIKLKSITSELKNSTYIIKDLEDLEGIETIFKELSEKRVILDGLVHCAGISPLMKVADNDIDTMIKAFTINCFSFVELMKYFQRDGAYNAGASVVAVSSVVAGCASYRQAIYGGSKAALEEIVRCLAKELIEKNIRINCVAPGIVDTEMFKKLCEESDSLRERAFAKYPLGLIPAETIAEHIELLLSDRARYTTGSVFTVDAGFLAWK